MFLKCQFLLSIEQVIIEANIIAPLVNLLQHAEFEVKKEAAWAISNATSGGSREQIQYVCVYPLLSSGLLFFVIPFNNSYTFIIVLNMFF